MGDDFQGRMFWLYAALLFLPVQHTTRVEVECVDGGALDDLKIDYSTPVEDGGVTYEHEYIQCKFHVSEEKTYSSAALCNPHFFGTKKSFLARAFEAFQELTAQGKSFVLVLVSNGDWDQTDKLKPEISEGGALRETFFTNGPRSDLGKIRASWCKHLDVSDAEAEPFFRSLRLRYRYLSQRDLLGYIDARLQLIGLASIDAARSHNSYDAVYREMIKNGETVFDRSALSKLCERENLGTPREPSLDQVRMAGIRSYVRGADYMDLECDPFICFCELFDGRAIRDPAAWSNVLVPALRAWCAGLGSISTKTDLELRLECHPSIAYAAGHLIGPRPRARILPAQGSKIGGSSVWAPDNQDVTVGWTATDIPISEKGSSVAVALSITHEIASAVSAFLRARNDLHVRTLRVYAPASGPGHTAIANGAEGWALAGDLAADFGKFADGEGADVVHVFSAAPNALTFALGRMKRPGDEVQTWEHNGDGTLGSTYVEAVRLK